ncbi:MAG: uracil-DNA glycosylase family protein [Pseudomonadota bacterium]
MTTTKTISIVENLGSKTPSTVDAPPNCRRCPRLNAFIRQIRRDEPNWYNRPVNTWLPLGGQTSVTLLIIGLAPGMRGANRTGLPFTGDASGDLLFSVLTSLGHATECDGGFQLHGTAITNAVRCVPPQNKPTAAETANCRDKYLKPTLRQFPNLQKIVTLGRLAHDATVKALGEEPKHHPFGHGKGFVFSSPTRSMSLTASYHCSRYNQNTGRITFQMLRDVFTVPVVAEP